MSPAGDIARFGVEHDDERDAAADCSLHEEQARRRRPAFRQGPAENPLSRGLHLLHAGTYPSYQRRIYFQPDAAFWQADVNHVFLVRGSRVIECFDIETLSHVRTFVIPEVFLRSFVRYSLHFLV